MVCNGFFYWCIIKSRCFYLVSPLCVCVCVYALSYCSINAHHLQFSQLNTLLIDEFHRISTQLFCFLSCTSSMNDRNKTGNWFFIPVSNSRLQITSFSFSVLLVIVAIRRALFSMCFIDLYCHCIRTQTQTHTQSTHFIWYYGICKHTV